MTDQQEFGKIIGNCVFCKKQIRDSEVFGRTKIKSGFEYWHPNCKKKPNVFPIGKCVYCKKLVYIDENFSTDKNNWMCHSECYMLMVNQDGRSGN